MGKLTSNRVYLDYNSTSPLARSVKNWLGEGDFLFANPSSSHSSGKKSDRFIRQTREYLFDFFNLSNLDYELFFHSGATEGINTLIRGACSYWNIKGKKVSFYCSKVDHSCVVNLKEQISQAGNEVIFFDVDENGDFDQKNLIDLINRSSKENIRLLNYTWVNNENGVVWPLENLSEIKAKTGCLISVDSVQAPGKIVNWWNINSVADTYSFSPHKFGAFKGIGFSFFKNKYKFDPLIVGGGQQKGWRSGTGNALGIYSIKLALEELYVNFDDQKLQEIKKIIEDGLINNLGENLEIFSKNAKNRNFNTIYFRIKGAKADVVTTALDIAGIDISSGSACSSGSVSPSRILLAMGRSENDAKETIRLSFGPNLTVSQIDSHMIKIIKILKRFI